MVTRGILLENFDRTKKDLLIIGRNTIGGIIILFDKVIWNWAIVSNKISTLASFVINGCLQDLKRYFDPTKNKRYFEIWLQLEIKYHFGCSPLEKDPNYSQVQTPQHLS